MPDALYGGTLAAPAPTPSVYWSYGGFSYGGEVGGMVVTPPGTALTRTATDSVGAITDGATHSAANYSRTVTDAVAAISDTATHTPVKAGRVLNDSFGVSDAATRHPGVPRSALDSWNVTDGALRGGGIMRTSLDSWALSDVTTFVRPGVSRSAVDAITFIGDVAQMRAVILARWAGTYEDIIVVTDSARGPRVPIAASDIIYVSDHADIPGRAPPAVGLQFWLVRRMMI